MHRFGWLLIGLGALLLLKHGGFFLLPLLLLFLFLNLGRMFAHGPHAYGGPQGWRGHPRHGHHAHGCHWPHAPAAAPPTAAPADEPQPYTGETTRL